MYYNIYEVDTSPIQNSMMDAVKIIRQDKNPEGRHIDGRYAKVSPQWCPKRTGINWRIR